MKSIIRSVLAGAAASALWMAPAFAADSGGARAAQAADHGMPRGSTCGCPHHAAKQQPPKALTQEDPSVSAVWTAP